MLTSKSTSPKAFFASSSTLLVALATFTTYLLSDPSTHILDAQKAFVSLAFFNLMRMSLAPLPDLIAQLMQVSVAVERLNSYLNAAEQDPKAIWRRAVNERLATEYAALWDQLDATVFLRVPDLDAVRRWRLDQESALPETQRKSAQEIDRFVEYYERVTRRMLVSSPDAADWVVTLGADHGVVEFFERETG